MNLKYLTFCGIVMLLVSCETESKQIIEETNIEEANIVEKTEQKYIGTYELMHFLKNASTEEFGKEYPEPFNQFEFNKVIAYEFDGKRLDVNAYQMKNKHFSLSIFNQRVLNNNEVTDLITLLSSNDTYGNVTAACFEPKLGIVFFNDLQVQFQVNICLDCNFLNSTLEIPATSFHFRTFEGAEGYPLKGFSKKGVEGIIDFSKKLDFQYKDYTPNSFQED